MLVIFKFLTNHNFVLNIFISVCVVPSSLYDMHLYFISLGQCNIEFCGILLAILHRMGISLNYRLHFNTLLHHHSVSIQGIRRIIYTERRRQVLDLILQRKRAEDFKQIPSIKPSSNDIPCRVKHFTIKIKQQMRHQPSGSVLINGTPISHRRYITTVCSHKTPV